MKWVYHITARDMQTEIYSIVFPFCPSTQFRRKIEMDIQIFRMWVPYRWSDYNWNSSIFTCEIPSWNPCRKKCRKDWLSFCTFPSKHIHIQHFWRVQPNKSCSSRSIKNSKSINTAESKKKNRKSPHFLPKSMKISWAPPTPRRRPRRHRRAQRRVGAQCCLGHCGCLR